jgi:hypothetical protein
MYEKSSPRERNGRLRHEENIKIDAVDVNVESELNSLKTDHAFVNTVTNFQFSKNV